MTVGKPVSFTSTHSLPPNDDITRDIGIAEVAGLDVTSELLKNGWAKVKDLKREPTEDDTRKHDLEAEAKAAGLGLWNPHGPQVRPTSLACILVSLTIAVTWLVSCSPSHDASGLSGFRFRVEGKISRWHVLAIQYLDHKLIILDVALVEQVRDGSTLRVRLFMPDGQHQLINIALAGVRCPRTSSKPDEPSEPWAEEVNFSVYMPSASTEFV